MWASHLKKKKTKVRIVIGHSSSNKKNPEFGISTEYLYLRIKKIPKIRI